MHVQEARNQRKREVNRNMDYRTEQNILAGVIFAGLIMTAIVAFIFGTIAAG